jgi:hypothetical protein
MGVTKSGPKPRQTWSVNVNGNDVVAQPTGSGYDWTVRGVQLSAANPEIEKVKRWGLAMVGWGEMLRDSFLALNKEVDELRKEVAELKSHQPT